MTIVNDYATNSLNKVHLNNQLTGKNVMPMKAHTSSNNNQFSMMRQIFQRTSKLHPENNTEKRGKNSLYQDHSQYLAKKNLVQLVNNNMEKRRLNLIQILKMILKMH